MMGIDNCKKRGQQIGDICFVLYLAVLVYCLFLAEIFGRTSDHHYAYNLIPFHEIKRFLTYGHILGTKAVFMNLAGNIACFIPLGFYLPWRNKRFCQVGSVFLTGFAVSLLIEMIQLLSRSGSFDVDDIMLNTFGAILGYLMYKILIYFRNVRIK